MHHASSCGTVVLAQRVYCRPESSVTIPELLIDYMLIHVNMRSSKRYSGDQHHVGIEDWFLGVG
jgi:hypothetical protein